jgi:hypothetical protein
VKRANDFSAKTRERAHNLLDAGMEMLHEYAPEGTLCLHCGAYNARFDEECPALLRCALERAATMKGDR